MSRFSHRIWRRSSKVGSAAAIAFMLGVPSIFAQSAPFSSLAEVTISGPVGGVQAGETFTVDVEVDLTGITGGCGSAQVPAVLGGYAIPVSFNRTQVLFVSSAACDSPQFAAAPTTTDVTSANAVGRVSIASSQSAQLAPVGNVCVARLTFQALGQPGQTVIITEPAPSISSSFQTCSAGSGGPASIPATSRGYVADISNEAAGSIVPVIASTAGSLGSFFRTAVQIHNPTDETITGRFVYHPQGIPGSDADPFLDYSVEPGKTVEYDDLLPAMNQSGLGSLDIVPATGPLPLSIIRIFNDAGEEGTTGMNEPQVLPSEALLDGHEARMITPLDPVAARFNIGVRTLSEGVTMTVISNDKDGDEIATITKTYPATYFEQVTSAAFLGRTIGESETLIFIIEEGSAIIYGSTTDNITQDPALQLAERVR